ncbi:MAG: SBBP repeat-containing protein, partial [bacterium]
VLHSLAVDALGNVFATGYSGGSGINDDYITVKYNSAGTVQWAKYYNGPGNGADTAYSLAVDGSGNVYVTGSSAGSGTGTDYATIKYNPSGIEQWVQRYNGPGNSSDKTNSLSVDASGNVYVAGVSAGSTTGDDFATIKYSQTGSSLTLNLTVFIEGFYNPASNNLISDTARVYLRNASAPYNTIDSSKKLLSSAGTGAFLFSNAANGVNYYLMVKHRNSIETWSSSAIQFSAGSSTYNFATVSTQAYGSNETRIDLSPLRFAIYSGDANQDGSVDLTDGSLVDNDAYNFLTGYIKTDVNGDDAVDIADATITDNNAFNFVSKITPP